MKLQNFFSDRFCPQLFIVAVNPSLHKQFETSDFLGFTGYLLERFQQFKSSERSFAKMDRRFILDSNINTVVLKMILLNSSIV